MTLSWKSAQESLQRLWRDTQERWARSQRATRKRVQQQVTTTGATPAVVNTRQRYEQFLEILAANDKTLDLFANIDDAAAGRVHVDLETMARQAHRAAHEVRLMCETINHMTKGRFPSLIPVMEQLIEQLQDILPPDREPLSVPMVVPHAGIRANQIRLVGGKAANLAEVWWNIAGTEIPPGFVITTAAFAHFMNHNDLWPLVDRLATLQRANHQVAMFETCQELSSAIRTAEVPAHVRGAIENAFDQLAASGPIQLAMRSSAVGEDSFASHAGQYHTELFVERGQMMKAYCQVLASAFSESAVSYRIQQGLGAAEVMMAVLCLKMLSPRCSGILFTRDYRDPTADRLVIGATAKIAAGIVAGEQAADEIVADGTGRLLEGDAALLKNDLPTLVRSGRLLEKCFKVPQDIEWAIDEEGRLFVLQTRPMVFAQQTAIAMPSVGMAETPILEGGLCACPGAASGVVAHFRRPEDLKAIRPGNVVVARHSAPVLSAVMSQCAAIVTEVGSPTGHMAILAREYDVPCMVNVPHALEVLQSGMSVTIDAWRCRIFNGALPVPKRSGPKLAKLDNKLVDETALPTILNRIAALITPLHLTDPTSDSFRPEDCLSLHDLTRFVHEKAFSAMFDLSDLADLDRHHAAEIHARLPFKLILYDVGGGVDPEITVGTPLTSEHVRSIPLQAFLTGLLDPRIHWDQPRPLSSSGFLSVLGESMTGPPAEAQQIGKTSYVVVSDEYMNFNTKAGYHFSTIDAYCSRNINRNYIHFRFAGGGAAIDRRARRVSFLRTVLEALDFQSRQRGDILWARLDKWDAELLKQRLILLGRLTLITRQMDMLMDSENSPSFFAQAFLKDQIDVF